MIISAAEPLATEIYKKLFVGQGRRIYGTWGIAVD